MTRRFALVFAVALALPCGRLHAQPGSPAGPVPTETLERRRAALLEGLGEGIAVIPAGEPRSIEGDYPQDSDYRERNAFFYLTGLEAPHARLVLVARESGHDEAVLYLPEREPSRERWTGPRLGPGAEAARLTGIKDVRPLSALPRAPDSIAAAVGAPELAGRVLWEGRRPAGHGRRGEPPTLEPRLAALRLVKDGDELRRLRAAIEITAEAQRAAMRAARPGMTEYELEALIEYTFRSAGAERVGFPSIVGSGPNGTVLHYDRSRRTMEAGDLVVVDIGAEYGYYSADVTRTFPVGGRFTPRQRALYELVLSSQRAAIDSVRPGITMGRLNEIARAHMRAHSRDLCAPTTCDSHFVHGLGHWLGMDVHDVGDYATPLEPGMVLTIEPGLYLPAEAIGIRVEDDVLVTATGAEILSAGAPRDPDAIETLMAEGYRLILP